MRQSLDTRNGLTCSTFDAPQDIDQTALLNFLNTSWQADYVDQPYFVFDHVYLSRLMRCRHHWIGGLITDRRDMPIGFEICIERTLYCRGQRFQAYYNRLFTIHADYRRQGLGSWLVRQMNHVLFKERGTALIVSAFHPGHAGFPTAQHIHQPIPDAPPCTDWRLQCIHQAPLWARRLDLGPLPPISAGLTPTRLFHQPHNSTWVPEPVVEVPTSRPWPIAEALNTSLATQVQIGLGFDANFQAQYLHRHDDGAGTFWYAFDTSAQCVLSYDIITLMYKGDPLGQLGRIQSVFAPHCTPDQLYHALHHICHHFQHRGCFLVSLLDHGVWPHTVLKRLSFETSGEDRWFTVRGLPSTLEAFHDIRPPHVLDI